MNDAVDRKCGGNVCAVCGRPASVLRNANPYLYEPERRCGGHPFEDTLEEATERELRRGAN